MGLLEHRSSCQLLALAACVLLASQAGADETQKRPTKAPLRLELVSTPSLATPNNPGVGRLQTTSSPILTLTPLSWDPTPKLAIDTSSSAAVGFRYSPPERAGRFWMEMQLDRDPVGAARGKQVLLFGAQVGYRY